MADPVGPTTIHFVRHAEVHNPQQILYGRLPRFGLSRRGFEQAQATGARLGGHPLAAVFSSPQLRARQTARAILAYHPGLKLHLAKRLAEVYTPFEGRNMAELQARQLGRYSGPVPGYEQPPDVLQRGLGFIRQMRRRFAGQQVAAVTHGDVLALIYLWAAGLPASQQGIADLAQFGLPGGYPAHACLMTLSYRTGAENEIPVLEYWK